jgi:hypothetical protein
MNPIAYDLEWYPHSYVVRLVGVWDERGYRSYLTVDSFLNSEVTRENRGRTFFAHAGGKYDVQHILERLQHDKGAEISAAFSGSSVILARVRRGRDTWTFCDSFYLLPDTLKKIGKTIGLAKGECDFSAPISELREYNARDCEIVYKGLLMLETGLNELGGEMRITLAASCMNLFRHAYLKRTITTSEALNQTLRPSYCASRVEVFARYAPEAEYFDINSSFPASMTEPQPGNLVRVTTKPPRDRNMIWFADCDIEVPDTNLPPLPYKTGGRIFFPWGTWRGIFTSADLQLLEETGGRVRKIYRVWHFEPFEDLQAYVDDIYAKKLDAEKRGDVFARFLYKRVLVSLYGKFGERTEKDRVLVNPEKTTCPHKPKHKGNTCIEIISPGIYRVKEVQDVQHAHVPISSYVTSLSRVKLYHGLAKTKTRYMCDTDSNVCGKGEKLPTGDALGEWKHEGTIRNATFLCPKVYAYTGKCGACEGAGCSDCKKSGEVRTVKCKGFSRLSSDGFDALARFEPVEVERTRGIKEGLRDTGVFGMARSRVTEKRLHEDTLPKRAPVGNETRAWNVEELKERI